LFIFSGCKNTPESSSEEPEVVTQLTSGDSDENQVRFSPDGKHIAYISDQSGRLAIFTKEL
jgi:Tol biopolymer transport system component